ncbi:MAG: fused MFS/spermidine synthase [Candidatus Altiarchaeota archaeon]|nr:fused MFS/spermidine synthase [Candidatus Altiarchaeota archaeon]
MDGIRKLELAAFTSGASVMVVEILGSRLLAPYFGSSTYVWSALIGVILASLSIGYYLGGKEADKNPSEKKLSTIMLSSAVLVSAIPFIAPYIAGLAMLTGYRIGPLFYATIVFSIPNVLMGMVPPYTIKLAAGNLGKIGSVAGDLYAMSTVGSIAGTLLCGFVLVPLMPITAIFIGVAAALLIAGILVGRPSKYIILFCIAASLIVAFSARTSGSENDILYKDKNVLYDKYSPYQRIVVYDDPRGMTRTMRLDVSFSGVVKLRNNLTAGYYANYYELPFVFRPNTTTVYMAGEGTGIGAKQIKISHPKAEVLITEIDEEVRIAAARFFNIQEGNGLSVEIGDSRQLLKQSERTYDLVIIDVFTSMFSIPTHFTTAEFYGEAKSRLTPGGILEINIISTLDEDALFLKSLCRTVGSKFPHVYLYRVAGSAQRTQLQNVILLASENPLELSPDAKIGEYETQLFDEKQLTGMLNHRIEDFNCSDGMLLTDDYSPTDYLIEPLMDRVFH